MVAIVLLSTHGTLGARGRPRGQQQEALVCPTIAALPSARQDVRGAPRAPLRPDAAAPRSTTDTVEIRECSEPKRADEN